MQLSTVLRWTISVPEQFCYVSFRPFRTNPRNLGSPDCSIRPLGGGCTDSRQLLLRIHYILKICWKSVRVPPLQKIDFGHDLWSIQFHGQKPNLHFFLISTNRQNLRVVRGLKSTSWYTMVVYCTLYRMPNISPQIYPMAPVNTFITKSGIADRRSGAGHRPCVCFPSNFEFLVADAVLRLSVWFENVDLGWSMGLMGANHSGIQAKSCKYRLQNTCPIFFKYHCRSVLSFERLSLTLVSAGARWFSNSESFPPVLRIRVIPDFCVPKFSPVARC